MQIRIQSTGEVVSEQGFRAMHPNTSMPQQLTEATINELGGDVVFEGPQAQPTRYQVAFSDGVEQISGKWYTKYSVSDMDAKAIAAKDAEQAKSVRAQRDTKLAALDWTQGKDIAAEVSVPAATLRQALRDVPSQAGFPWEITWPDAE
jgi:hypothetical protein